MRSPSPGKGSRPPGTAPKSGKRSRVCSRPRVGSDPAQVAVLQTKLYQGLEVAVHSVRETFAGNRST
eukprot:7534562-Pyramimonas_sp.AAC.1